MSAEVPDIERVQQEDDAQADQDNGADRYFAGVQTLTGAKGASQTKGIGRGLPQLNSPGGADGIDNLVDVEGCNADTADHAHGLTTAAGAEDEHSEDQQMRQSLGI